MSTKKSFKASVFKSVSGLIQAGANREVTLGASSWILVSDSCRLGEIAVCNSSRT